MTKRLRAKTIRPPMSDHESLQKVRQFEREADLDSIMRMKNRKGERKVTSIVRPRSPR